MVVPLETHWDKQNFLNRLIYCKGTQSILEPCDFIYQMLSAS